VSQTSRKQEPGGSPLTWPGELVAGATYPLRALVVLNRTPRLWQYVVVPVLVNLLVGVLLYASLLYGGWQGISALMSDVPEPFGAVALLLQGALVVVLLIVIGFVLLRFGVVLGSPWYSQLAEQLESIRLGIRAPEEKTSAATIVRDIGQALSFELKKLLLFLTFAIPLLLLSLTGVGSLVTWIGWITLGATIICLDMLDSSLSRRRLRFRRKLAIIRRNLPATASFALVCLGLISVPLLNLLAIPLCVTAGTLFFCDRIWPGMKNTPLR
jgi:CysZ protein